MIIPVGFAQATHIFNVLGTDKRAAVTYGVALQGADFGENRVANLHTAFVLDWRPWASSAWVCERTLLKYGPVATGPSFEFVNPGQGQGTGAAISPAVALLVRKRTSLGGRTGRGRFFLPGLQEGDVGSSGQLDSTVRTAIQANMDSFLAELTTLDMPMRLFHNASSDPTDVTSLQVDAEVATQRRRQRS